LIYIHLADAFIQSDLQMRTKEAVLTVGQQYASAMILLSLIEHNHQFNHRSTYIKKIL